MVGGEGGVDGLGGAEEGRSRDASHGTHAECPTYSGPFQKPLQRGWTGTGTVAPGVKPRVDDQQNSCCILNLKRTHHAELVRFKKGSLYLVEHCSFSSNVPSSPGFPFDCNM